MSKKVTQTNKLKRKYMYIIYFFIFAFLGWFLETLFCAQQMGYWSKRGFLYGPICPIYGFGSLILITFLSRYSKKPLKLFIYSIVVFTVFEYFVSFALDALYGLKWWDYSERSFNINGRISILHCLIWGFGALIFIHFVYPFIKKHVNLILSKIPYKIQLSIIYFLCAVFITDTIFSIIHYIKI